MPSITEDAGTALHGALVAGVDTLSAGQTVTFTKYVKLVLPLDGFVFWLRSDLVGAAALLNAGQIGPNPVAGTATFDQAGSLHYATDRRQLEDETISVNRVVFTSDDEVQPFNEISPVVMFVGAFDGLRFAFASRRSYYKQADIHHYVGDAIYPALQAQIIDTIEQLGGHQLVVSNSLPVWLGFSATFPVYPSFLVPDNLPPPYAVAHVLPDSTMGLQAAPYLDKYLSHWQLVTERVRVTFYGVRNDQALDFLDAVAAFSLDTDIIGIQNMPVIRDEKRGQAELAAIAMKKSAEFTVSYYQTRINDLARQMILSAVPTFTPSDTP